MKGWNGLSEMCWGRKRGNMTEKKGKGELRMQRGKTGEFRPSTIRGKTRG